MGFPNYCEFIHQNAKTKKEKKNQTHEMEVYLLKIDLMKKAGDLGFDAGAWRLNVGVCSCNVSTCSSQFCLVSFRVPLISRF